MQPITVESDAKLALFQNSPFFSKFSGDTLLELERGSSIQKYAANEIILVEGESNPSLYNLIKGSVKLYKLSSRGRELIVIVLEDGVTFNEVPVFDGYTNPVSVAALEESTFLIIPRVTLFKALEKHPEHYPFVLEHLANNLRGLMSLIEEMAFFPIPNRLARLLLRLPADHTYTHDQLAARLGTVREVVSRALRALERAGAIHCQRRRVEIVDRSVLETWANRSNPA